MLEHFINIHKLTGKKEYLDAAYEEAEAIIGESTHQDLRWKGRITKMANIIYVSTG